LLPASTSLLRGVLHELKEIMLSEYRGVFDFNSKLDVNNNHLFLVKKHDKNYGEADDIETILRYDMADNHEIRWNVWCRKLRHS